MPFSILTTRLAPLALVLVALAVTASPAAHAQAVDGQVVVRNAPETAPTGNVLHLFKAFRDGEHQIVLEFEGEPVEIVFFSEVRRDGERLGRFESLPTPYIPGGMFMAPEAFGFVSLMGYEREGDDFGRLEPGTYEVRLEARPVRAQGEIRPAVLRFEVPRR